MGILMILIVLLQIINHNTDHIRVFTIGIGETVNCHLIRNLAKIGFFKIKKIQFFQSIIF